MSNNVSQCDVTIVMQRTPRSDWYRWNLIKLIDVLALTAVKQDRNLTVHSQKKCWNYVYFPPKKQICAWIEDVTVSKWLLIFWGWTSHLILLVFMWFIKPCNKANLLCKHTVTFAKPVEPLRFVRTMLMLMFFYWECTHPCHFIHSVVHTLALKNLLW